MPTSTELANQLTLQVLKDENLSRLLQAASEGSTGALLIALDRLEELGHHKLTKRLAARWASHLTAELGDELVAQIVRDRVAAVKVREVGPLDYDRDPETLGEAIQQTLDRAGLGGLLDLNVKALYNILHITVTLPDAHDRYATHAKVRRLVQRAMPWATRSNLVRLRVETVRPKRFFGG